MKITLKNNQKLYREYLRQRFLSRGLTSGFAEHEIIELLLTLCLPRRDVKSQAQELLQKFGSIQEIFDADIGELFEIKGMGSIGPIAIKMIKSFSEIYLRESIDCHSCILDNYERLENFWRFRLGGIKKEIFEIALLNTRLRLIKNGIFQLEEGGIDRINISPRKIMEHALRNHASALIIAHNHPSGSAMPSEKDCIVTKTIKKVAESLEIRLIDHIIVARHEIFSFRKSKLIERD